MNELIQSKAVVYQKIPSDCFYADYTIRIKKLLLNSATAILYFESVIKYTFFSSKNRSF